MLRRRRKERRAIEEAIAEANGENVALNREWSSSEDFENIDHEEDDDDDEDGMISSGL